MNKVLSYNDVILTYDGYDLYAPDTLSVYADYYYGVIQAAQRPDVSSIDLGSLTHIPGQIHTALTINYPEQLGYLVLCIPFSAHARRRWFVATNNRGPIGGPWEGPEEKPVKSYFNLFPHHEVVEHNGVLFRVYLSTYPTILKRPMVFYSTGILYEDEES